jgi:hypothetical protein
VLLHGELVAWWYEKKCSVMETTYLGGKKRESGRKEGVGGRYLDMKTLLWWLSFQRMEPR